MKKKKSKTIVLVICIIVLIFSIFIGAFFVFKNSVNPRVNEEVEIQITNVDYGKQLFKKLEEKGLVSNADLAYYYARIYGYNLNCVAGNFKVNPQIGLENILKYLSNGNNTIQETVIVKLNEGYRAIDFAYIIAENTNLDAEALLAYWNDENVIREYMNDYCFLTEDIFNSNNKMLIEGYLFPDTYELFVNTTNDQVTRKILDQTLMVFNEYKDFFNTNKYSIHEIFTLASIIQRESSNISDMRKVSSVFYNRLSIGMYLQSSVTVCYALDIGVNDDWTKCEITQNELNPYNTYQYPGFPPGPIAAFSKDALYAALNPEESDYYYFIGDVCGDGKTYFATTYQEQLENQARYLTCY